MITLGRDFTTNEVVVRNHENGTFIKLDSDPEMFSMVVGMLVEELNELDPDTEYMLEELDVGGDETDDDEDEALVGDS